MLNFRKNFGFAVIVAVLCLAVAFIDGFLQGGRTLGPALQALIIAGLLGILELSLSFDNAVLTLPPMNGWDSFFSVN